MHPTLANGKICYVEMPANNVSHSADFYRRIFGWNTRQRDDGRLAFDDTTREVSGMWVLDRKAAETTGMLMYIMVDSVSATLAEIAVSGGQIVQPIGADAPDITARFRDPAGNVIGLFQQPPAKA
jgi:predicted enzyme related to lactoylglutathione lyase